jgi:hypothetical protein
LMIERKLQEAQLEYSQFILTYGSVEKLTLN